MTQSTDNESVITIKKYANRRLYNTDASSYVTLEDLAEMVKDGTDFVVKDAKTGASIQVPKNWDLSMSLNPIAEIQVGNEFADKYVMVIIEPKSDFPRGTSINSYANLVLRSMKMENPGLSRSDNKQLNINGKPATQFRLTGRVEGVNVVYWITVVRGARHFYQIVGWTSSRSESKNRESIMNVVNSFEGQ